MPSLLEQQRGFAGELLEKPCGAGRLAVYRANVYGTWRKALASAFPIVRKIVGDEFFEGLAHVYAKGHPSCSGDLNEYGERLPEFLETFPDTRDLPYLPDVARMEWLAHRAHFAADAAPFDFAQLPALQAEQQGALLRPVLAPACALLASAWPLAALWAAHQDSHEGPVAVDLKAGPDWILVHRPSWRAEVCRLGAGDYRLLASARDGLALDEALEVATAADPAFEASNALARWVAARAIVRLERRP